VALGVGLFSYDPYAFITVNGQNEKVFLRPLGTEGQGHPNYPDRKPYSSMGICIPLTVGFKYNLSPSMNFFAEAGYRYTNTDYIDDVSTTYVGGNNFLRRIDAVAGESYLIMLNNFGSDVSGNNLGSGFNINFTGSTAVFNDQVPPKMVSASASCASGTETILQLSEQVKCSSIAPDGSDFLLSSSATVLSATGVNCNTSNQGYTDKIRIVFSQALTGGIYQLKAKNGTDNNSLLDLCDNALQIPDSIPLIVYPDNSVTHTVDTVGCQSVVYLGQTYTSSRVLRDTIRNGNGCDSVYNVTNITVYRKPKIFAEVVANCDSVVFRGVTYHTNGTVIDTFRSIQGCDSFLHIYRIQPEHFEMTVTADPPEPVMGDHVTFTVSANVPDYLVTAWHPTDVFKFQNATEQSIFIQDSDTVKVIGISALGCVDTAILYIKADSLIPVVVMPNAFSPNGDGLNDVFEPKFVNKSGYIVKSFRVFDRWGKLIFQAQGTRKAAWNGRYSNQDKIADVGTYFYYIDVLFIDGTKTFIKGDVTIVR
ncbi:MAG: gliding motility-associated C-terminal domain-containing protein, partial [Sphingobacteriales bacterium]